MDDFYAAREATMTPLLWTNIAPPFTDYGASFDIDGRDQESLNLALIPLLQAQFDQSLRAIIAFETAKREGRSNGDE